jgi:hypothetical protein
MQGDTMARPPKYATDEEKPVSVTFRIPRTLYDQAQQHARQRRTTLTELVCEGLQMRLETPTDPRDILATQDITVMQELEQMIDARVYAILAAQAPSKEAEDKSKAKHNGNASYANTEPAAPYERGKNKLTPLQAAEMRGKRAAGTPIKALVEEYGISKATYHRYKQEPVG